MDENFRLKISYAEIKLTSTLLTKYQISLQQNYFIKHTK